MPRSKVPIMSLEEVKARFEEWRQNRNGKSVIPDELWSAAAGVARREGVSRTATALRLGWSELKRRMTATESVSCQPGTTPLPGFVELLAPSAQSRRECTFELEGRSGKLKILLTGASASELAALSRALWETVA